jgi:oxysterol-binding protein-related protein 9/10/11
MDHTLSQLPSETSHIVSKNYVCSIEYTRAKATFLANLTLSKSGKEHVIEGLWHLMRYIGGPRNGEDFHDVIGEKEEVTAFGGECSGEMGEFEIRKLWNLVAKGITSRKGDFETEKNKIEVRDFEVFRGFLHFLSWA